MNAQVDIKVVKTADKDDIISLYRDAGWWSEADERDSSFIDNIAADSFLFAAAMDAEGRMIGMGRVLSDGCSDGYIQDVAVLKSHRKQGIGEKIIQVLANEMKKHGIDWICLIAEPGTRQFYEKLGFRELSGHTPMRLLQPCGEIRHSIPEDNRR